jgi:hypothetical protein
MAKTKAHIQGSNSKTSQALTQNVHFCQTILIIPSRDPVPLSREEQNEL